MEAVPSLCASGTMGVAAAGLAFGRPQHSIATRPTSKRRTMVHGVVDETQYHTNRPQTPSSLPLSTSASTSRLRKRSSLARSIASAAAIRGGTKGGPATPEDKQVMENGPLAATDPTLHVQRSYQSLGRRSLLLNPTTDTTNRSSWLRRKSTLSSLKSRSPATTDRPGSAAVSYSNGSTAPMLPDLSAMSPSPAPRNKLVKRSSSQRALATGNSMHSTLRRPATSHQRSATLQQQFLEEEDIAQRPKSMQTPFGYEVPGPLESYDDCSQIWRPFFRSEVSRSHKGAASKKRNVRGGLNKEEPLRRIVPDITELPTLVLATSISTRSSDEPAGRASNVSVITRPFTPAGFETAEAVEPDTFETPIKRGLDSRPRSSFSLSEMFPTPSPLTWKIPRTGSLRSKKAPDRTAGGKRVLSAPQPARNRRMTGPRARRGTFGDTNSQAGSPPVKYYETQSGPGDQSERPPSSPLPPLHRLSVFEVDLPSTIPSYPTSPGLEDVITPSRNFSSLSSPSLSSQMRGSVNRDVSHRPSGAPSDLTSTLVGSDNEYSRMMSGNEEDVDGRSETVYDSTRTGATGASLSGRKRPPIDTIFDESSSSEGFLNQEHNESGARSGGALGSGWTSPESLPVTVTPRNPSSKGNRNLLRDNQPVQPAQPPKSSLSPKTETSPAASKPLQSVELAQDDEEPSWAFGDLEDHRPKPRELQAPSPFQAMVGASFQSSRSSKSTPKRRQSPPNVAQDRSSKAHLFELSEQVDRENSPRGSPRPKTVDGRHGVDLRSGRFNGRRGPNALHLRSQSVPVPEDHRIHGNNSMLDSRTLGNKGPSEEWDGDFEFDELSTDDRQNATLNEGVRTSLSSGMLVPRAILERQASVHGQFGQVKELTLLVEELRRLQKRASELDIMRGQAIELWKEAEGIIDLATIDEDEHDPFFPRSPNSPSVLDFEAFNDDSPLARTRRRSGFSPPKDEPVNVPDDRASPSSSRPSQDLSKAETPPVGNRPRKESSAKAKSVLDHIHSERSQYDPVFLEAKNTHKKLPFDTTSLKDLVTRAGVVTRALKEIVRRAEGGSSSPDRQPPTPKDPPLSQIFHQPSTPTLNNKLPSHTQSPKSPTKSPKTPKGAKNSTPFMGGSISANDNEINGHMKMMTVV